LGLEMDKNDRRLREAEEKVEKAEANTSRLREEAERERLAGLERERVLLEKLASLQRPD
jgi:hypothetical protein